MDKPNSLTATLLGLTALLLWAMSALIISELENIPTFQLSGTVFFIAFLYTCVKLTRNREWSTINPSIVVFIVGFLAVLNNQVAYVYSIKLLPPEQAEIIYYLWPIITVIISILFFEKPRIKSSKTEYFFVTKSLLSFLRNKFFKRPGMQESSQDEEKFFPILLHALSKFVPVLSAFLGFSGIYILLTDGQGLGEISLDRVEGYLSALIAAGAWVLYSLFSRYNPNIPEEMSGIWCGMSVIPCFVINSYCDNFVMPTIYEWILMLFIGIGILSQSLKMWAVGIRHGHFSSLTVMSYMTPLVSILILIAAGKADFKGSILIACQLVILGAALCTLIEWLRKRTSPIIVPVK